MSTRKTGVLLLNLGTPDAPEPFEVGRYLKQFLMDPMVVDIPALLRWILVNVLIVPRRKYASALLYKKIWTPEGSPLLTHLLKLNAGVQANLGEKYLVVPAMRYGKPSVGQAIAHLAGCGVDQLVVMPLYPQYSLAATESSKLEVDRCLKVSGLKMTVKTVPAFYDDPGFLDVFTSIAARELAQFKADHVVFSFHGLPERHVQKTDPVGTHCLQKAGCCDQVTDANRNCYRAQCFSTARALAQRLKLDDARFSIAFQSRLGRTPWIAPYTDHLYSELPKKGVKNLAVMSPSFVSDCLETLEEISIRGREQWIEEGGTELRLIPSLNSDPAWANTCATLIRTAEAKR